MFSNGVRCDLYTGTGAGKKLLKDFRSATDAVRVVSPFLSPSLVSELIELANRGLAVELITTDQIEDFYGDYDRNIHKMLRQHRHIDEQAAARQPRKLIWRLGAVRCTPNQSID